MLTISIHLPLKRIAATLLFTIAAFYCNAQAYKRMLTPGDSSTWYSFVIINGTPHDGGYYQYSIRYRAMGDSVFNALHYTPVQAFGTYRGPGGGKDGLAGYLREDTTTRRVYFKPADKDTDILLYDFNLNVGDSFYMYFNPTNNINYQKSAWAYVKSTKQMEILGVMRKTIRLVNKKADINEDYFAMQWYEGIGSMKSPIYSLAPGLATFPTFENAVRLICAFSGAETNFHELSKPDCDISKVYFLSVIGIEETEHQILTFLKKGEDYEIMWPIENGDATGIRIYDYTGRQYSPKISYTGQTAGKNYIKLNSENLPGLFIIQVNTKNGCFQQKILK